MQDNLRKKYVLLTDQLIKIEKTMLREGSKNEN